MNWTIRVLIQNRVNDYFTTVLANQKFTKSQIRLILEGSGTSEFSSITNLVVREMRVSYSFRPSDDANYIVSIADKETEKWLRNNQNVFDDHIHKKLKI